MVHSDPADPPPSVVPTNETDAPSLASATNYAGSPLESGSADVPATETDQTPSLASTTTYAGGPLEAGGPSTPLPPSSPGDPSEPDDSDDFGPDARP